MGPEGADGKAPSRDHFANGTSPTRRRSGCGRDWQANLAQRRPRPGAEAPLDSDSREWVERLRVGHPRHHQTVASLHDVLKRVAVYELSRRRHQLRSIRGPEFDDLAQQAADDALVNILDRLDEFRGLSRFTTWAYTFVMFEVSAKVARHAWQRQPPDVEQLEWDRLPDPMAPHPRNGSSSGHNLRRCRGRSPS